MGDVQSPEITNMIQEKRNTCETALRRNTCFKSESYDVGSHQSSVLFLKWPASLCFYHQVTNDIITLHMDKLWWSFWIQRTPTFWSFQPAWHANLFWAGQHCGEVFLILSLFFSRHGKLYALEASAVSEVREGLVENDDGFDLVLVDHKEKVRVI